MKNQLKYISLILSTFLLFSFQNQLSAQKVKIDFENVKEKCKKLAYEDRVRITVARFNVTAPNAQRAFGGELATMLTNALQEVNCFRVLQSITNISDSTDEIGMGDEGYTTNNSSPSSGKMLGAQAIVTGEVTEFSEGETGAGAFGLKLSSNKARIGFIIQVVIPQTREIIWSKSIEAEGKKPGSFGGLKLLNIKIAGGTKSNTAIADAVERGIIKAVKALADEKDDIPFPKPDNSFAENKVWNSSNCPFLKTGNVPSVMILIPERHITRYLLRPNGESEIISKFANAGFTVIDPAVYATVRKGARFDEALKNPIAAASLASEFGADILIIGEGVSQRAGNAKNGRIICRATVDARVINVKNSQILMAKNATNGANDITETSAANTSLRNAGGQIADYFLEQFCTRNISSFSNTLTMKGGSSSEGSLQTTYLKISETDFSKLKRLSDILKAESKIKDVKRSSFSNTNAVLEIKHLGNSDELLDILSSKTSNMCEISGFDDNEIQLKMK